jgi:phosphonate transport system permease protein
MSEVALELQRQYSQITFSANGKIRVSKPRQNLQIKLFLIFIAFISIVSIYFLDIDWAKLFSRVPDLGIMFVKLANFNFKLIGQILSDFALSVSVTILATVYSAVLGILFGAFAARNVIKSRVITTFTRSFFTFIRAVPTPVWVLLMLVCVGLGPAPAIAGLSVHATAFFTRAFAQSYEEVDADVIEALASTGANKVQIFFSAILPAAMSSIVAWCGLRFEINFSESAILGMVGAGGIGYSIMNNMQGYDYGSAGVAIVLVYLFAFSVELLFTKIKLKYVK